MVTQKHEHKIYVKNVQWLYILDILIYPQKVIIHQAEHLSL